MTQPDSLSVLLGHPLTITCKVSYSVHSYWTHWNRQAPGKGLDGLEEQLLEAHLTTDLYSEISSVFPPTPPGTQ